jgi:nicotinic acid phosphoribosyltransferase
MPRTIELYQQFRGRCQLAFGIGTNLTNDLGDRPRTPLQIVIKMTRCNGQPVAKLSDTPGKGMCDDEKYLAYLRQVFEIPRTPVSNPSDFLPRSATRRGQPMPERKMETNHEDFSPRCALAWPLRGPVARPGRGRRHGWQPACRCCGACRLPACCCRLR